jgi:hypothetical protein
LVALSGATAADADVAPIRTISSMQLRRKRFDRPDEIRTVEKARIELVELGELAVGRAIFEPGWRWSEHVKPIVGTESCQVHHLGYVCRGICTLR